MSGLFSRLYGNQPDGKKKENCAHLKFNWEDWFEWKESNEGSEEKLVFSDTFGLHDVDCSEKLTIICEMKA